MNPPHEIWINEIESRLSKDLNGANMLCDKFIADMPTWPYAYLLKAHIGYTICPQENQDKWLAILDVGIFHAFQTEAYSELGGLFNEKGIIYKSELRMVDAINSFYLSLQYLTPSQSKLRSMIHFNLATTLLSIGQYERGWQEYGWLFIDRDTYNRGFKQPYWRGYMAKDKTILVHNEQAFGDLIFFFRYIRFLKPYFKKIILEIPDRLMKFMTTSNLLLLDGTNDNEPDPQFEIFQRVDGPNPNIQFDVHADYAQLPGHFHTMLDTIPKPIPYFKADLELVEKWGKYLKLKYPEPHIKIAINWCGKPTNDHEHLRKIPLEKFLSLLPSDTEVDTNTKKIKLYSIQKFYGLDQLKSGYPVIDLGPLLDRNEAFTDTAALMSHMDIVITSDTSIAHVAGSLGYRVWVLLPYNAEWRWLLDRSDSPWYGSNMRLFRQPQPYDWDTVFKQVKEEINKIF